MTSLSIYTPRLAMLSTSFYCCTDLRRIEAGASGQPLMQRAGRAAADLGAAICADRGAAILILAGPGNNGGDAFETARLLRQRFYDTHVVFVGAAENLPVDAANARQRFLAAGGTLLTAIPGKQRWSLIIDGFFGIGLTRAITEPYAGFIGEANALAARDGCPLLALDCPSGLDSDTGARHGATIRASHTISFIGSKPGLLTADGPDYCGEISIAKLDLDAGSLAPDSGRTLGLDLFAAQLKARPRNSHKGSNGNAGILGGAPGMVGAALLAARAALRLGSGRVYVGLLDARAPVLDAQQPELMLRTAQKLLSTELTALACGPGMGQTNAARVLLEDACTLQLPLLLDADALNLLAAEGELKVALAARSAPTLLTPHPTEAARLLDCDVAAIQADRLSAALELATLYKACVALKGCGTIIATADGTCFINTNGNPGLATAGSGDVLSGIITALLAQGWPVLEALLAAVHLHGAAADRLVAEGCGPLGLTAGELIDSARFCLNQWISSASEH
ncbi:NAD(P)H-hydrate dehydratase [Propionivibrio sp.]|uniref:NAD(P)H-hydrate dehydratase n=1 Tax=Propionivibrio sp. TaxID=2212460 RepID=UPI00262B3266|nr:NAD(P)H-hydrate dehydratase [Propionivibrio sp.]